MGDINEVISVDAGPGIAGLKEFTAALEQASAKFTAAQEKFAKGFAVGGGAAGADKLAASMDKAAASIEAAASRASAAMGRLSTASRGATGGLDAAAGSADKMAAANDRLAGSADASAAALDKQAVAGERAGKAGAVAAEGGAAGFMKFAKAVTIGFGVAAVYGIDKAMKFNAEVTRLYTAAGLTHAPFQQVSRDLLQIGTKTGYTGEQIAQAMYHPVSAGLSLSTSLGLVTQAANLANIHGANLEDTTYALSSVMKAYNQSTKDVVPTAALLNSVVGQGDMRFQDFNQSVKNWAPTGASMGISIQSMGAGLAYLTDRGNSAEVASTRMTMGLSMVTAGSKAANTYLRDLGLTTGTLDLKNKSLQQTMLKGGLTTNKFAADLKKPDGLYVALTDLQHAFDKAGLSKGQADQVMAKLFGGGRSDKAILSLMQNLDGVRQKYEDIGKGVSSYGSSVAKEQATAQQKWKDFKAGMTNLATGFGGTLLPYFTSLAGQADKFLGFLQKSKGASDLLVGSAGALAAIFAGNKLAGGVSSAFKTAEAGLRGVGKISEFLHIPGLDKLANIGSGGAAAGMQRAATTQAGAAGTMLDAARIQAEAAGVSVKGAGAAGAGEAAAGGAVTRAGSALGAALMTAAGAWLLGHGAGYFLGAPTKKDTRTYQHDVPGWFQAPANFVFGGKAPSVYRDVPKVGGPVSGQNWQNWYHDVFGGGPKPANDNFAPGYGGNVPRPVRMANDQFAPGYGPNARPMANDQFAPGYGPKPNLTQFTSTLAQAMGKPVKLAPPDLSALTGAKGKALADGKAISDAVGNALKKPAKAAAPDLSAYTSAAGKARGDGVAISAGLASGIEAGKGAAVAAANDVANSVAAAMAHALQTHSPSRVTHKIGKQAVDGLVIALQGGQAAVTAAAQALGKQVAKAADITVIDAAIGKATGYAGKDSALVKWLRGEQGKLHSLAAQRTRLEQEIADSQQVAKSVISSASIMGAGSYTPALAAAGGPLAASATITGLQGMAADQKAYAQQLAQLKKMGLNATSLDQLAQAGATAGLPVAQGLAQGGKGAIQQVNQLESQIHGSAAKIGDVGGPAMYQAGLDAGNGLAAGLKASLAAVDSAMAAMAKSIVAAIKKELKISSPSQLMAAEVGMPIPQGVALGIDQGVGTAMSAMGRMGGQLAAWRSPAGYGNPAAGGSYGGHGGGSVVIHNHYSVTVQGNVHTENDLLRALQERHLTNASNNWQGGWRLPGRAV